MKACFLLAILLVLATIWEAKGNCDLSGLANCKVEYQEEIRENPNNVEEKCEAIKELKECLAESKCDVPFDLNPDVDSAKETCGVAALSLNIIAVFLLTSIMVLKNLL